MTTHVEATLIPAGKALTKSANLTPRGLSSKHNPVKFCSGIEGILPTQRPISQPVPVVRVTFCSRVQFVNRCWALMYAERHALDRWGFVEEILRG